MGRGVIIIAEGGRCIGKMAAIELAMIAMKEMPVTIMLNQNQIELEKLSHKISPFDILPLRLAPIPELIELTNKKGKPLEDPKSKYINRPIKNYRR